MSSPTAQQYEAEMLEKSRRYRTLLLAETLSDEQQAELAGLATDLGTTAQQADKHREAFLEIEAIREWVRQRPALRAALAKAHADHDQVVERQRQVEAEQMHVRDRISRIDTELAAIGSLPAKIQTLARAFPRALAIELADLADDQVAERAVAQEVEKLRAADETALHFETEQEAPAVTNQVAEQAGLAPLAGEPLSAAN